jgi:phenylpyruvate tautomerase PptA (4-oxalocrotonate tautomerase family)
MVVLQQQALAALVVAAVKAHLGALEAVVVVAVLDY